MNQKRRNKLSSLSSKLQTLLEQLEEVNQEESEVIDNTPENLQESERFFAAELSIDEMDEAATNINEAIDHLNEIINYSS